MSWVFLTDRHAYKLKKPVRDDYVDLRTVEARRRNAIEELRVNRRFNGEIYLDTLPLMRGAGGALRIAGEGKAVDWLLRMRRLPADRMLDRVIADGSFRVSALTPVIERLCGVYRESAVELPPPVYRMRLASLVETDERELCRPAFGLPAGEIEQLCARQLRFLEQAEEFDRRVRESRIVEGHGDLRPEHICLEAVPRFIDALEFSRDLRTLDAADELGFLALECERLGAPEARSHVFGAYKDATGDAPPDALVHFYQSLRAVVRAHLAIRHLLVPQVRNPDRWPAKARRYLDLAGAHLDACG